ncbi:MAG: phosphomannomutase/phosphoglucomutase [Patescibacteria group bacterium]
MSTDSQLSAVFKAYDIRGLSPEQIDAAFARRLGKAIVVQFKPKKVLVGRDMRLTSSVLESALIDGLTSSGVDVVRIGLCSTPMFNILIGLADNGFDLGVMVTASHNPGKYNGFKIDRGNCEPVGEGSGMEELRDTFLASKEVVSSHIGTVVDDPTALDRYLDHVLKLAALPDDMPHFKVAIDAGNGMAGAVLPRLLSRLPWLETVPLFFEPDGTFPNHEANPLKRETLTHLIQVVKDDKCDLGVAFDGDADRVGFVDELGVPLPGDLSTAFLAQELLPASPGGLVLYDVRSSLTVPEAVAEAGGRAEMCKVGHANIKKLMHQDGAIFGGEVSMHYYFHDLWNCESGDLAMLLILRNLAKKSQPFSALWQPLQRYFHSEEINFEVKDKPSVIERLKATYAPKASLVSELDGIRLEFRNPADPKGDWWFNVRASNTEPLLRLNVEAATPESLAAHLEELSAAIKA